jgi:hypothetical protein
MNGPGDILPRAATRYIVLKPDAMTSAGEI